MSRKSIKNHSICHRCVNLNLWFFFSKFSLALWITRPNLAQVNELVVEVQCYRRRNCVIGSDFVNETFRYYVNRDTLFSYHKASEIFLQRLMALYVASHYKVFLILYWETWTPGRVTKYRNNTVPNVKLYSVL